MSRASKSRKDGIHVLARAVIIDQDHLLVCKTLDLPVPFYFLPGGHVELDESAEETVLRELKEETGTEAHIEKFLGCLEHRFEPGHSSICHHHEYNLIFKVSAPTLSADRPIPQLEKHIQPMWVPLNSLSGIDFRPEPLKKLLFEWLESADRFFISCRDF